MKLRTQLISLSLLSLVLSGVFFLERHFQDDQHNKIAEQKKLDSSLEHSKSEDLASLNAPVLETEYQRIESPVKDLVGTNSHIKVTEFFSYGCHWCSQLEKSVEPWKASLPSDVSFERVPVIFHKEWLLLAKAFYTAKALGVESKLTPLMFKAIHEDHHTFQSEAELVAFFEMAGISAEDFKSTFSFSPMIEGQIASAQSWLREGRIVQIPTFVVNGRFSTDTTLVAGKPERLLKVVDHLIEKERSSASK